MSALVRVLYVSAIVDPLTPVDVQAILGAAQVKNRRLDLTGMLVQSAAHFAQVLEGRQAAVESVMARVAKDARHRDVRVLLQQPITRRHFDRWAMGWVYRDDMSAEMRRLHERGPLDAADAFAWVERLAPDTD